MWLQIIRIAPSPISLSILYVNVNTDYSNFKGYMQTAVHILQANIFVTSTVHLPEVQF